MTAPRDFIAHEAAAAPTPKGTPRPWWEGRPYVAFLIIVSTLPLWWPAFPPLVDLPGHMGRFEVAHAIGSDAAFQRWFDFRWLPIGNLGVDILVSALAPLLGVEAATKLVVMAIPAMTVAGMLWVAREVHNRLPPTMAFAVPLAYSHPFLFGFVNFALSMALALLALGLWLRLGRLGRTGLRAILFVPISFVVFFAHTFGWGTMGLLIFSAEAVRQHDRGLSWWRAGLKAGLLCLVMALPLLLMAAWRSGDAGGRTLGWFAWSYKWEYLTQILRDRWMWWDIGLAALLALVPLGALAHRKLTLSRNLIFSGLVLGTGFVLLPRVVFGSAYADMRLAPFVLLVLLLSIRFTRETDLKLGRTLAIAALAVALARIATLTASLGMAGAHQARQSALLERVQPGQTVVAMVMSPCKGWALRRNDHLPSMAIVRRHAFANDQWRLEGSALLDVHRPELRWFRNDPSEIVRWPRCPREGWSLPLALDRLNQLRPGVVDYLWTIDTPKVEPALLGPWRLVAEADGARLYAPVGEAAPR